jgi:hypothetical protein
MPEAGISKLRRRLSGVYSWLLDHDREWLAAHRPPSSPPNKPLQQMQLPPIQLKKAPPKQDRINQDAQTAEAIRATAYRFVNNPVSSLRKSYLPLYLEVSESRTTSPDLARYDLLQKKDMKAGREAICTYEDK